MLRMSHLKSRLEKLEAEKCLEEGKFYTTERDEDGILNVCYLDGIQYQVPPIKMRPYQIELINKILVEKVRKAAIERPRRSGKEIESWSIILQAAIEFPGLYLMVYPTNVRARKILWEGSVLIDNVSVPFLSMIPTRLIKGNPNNIDMTIKLHNNSVIWIVGSDIDPGKLRGTNPLGVVLAECAFQDPFVMYTIMPALKQNNGFLIAQSTFDGMNHFYHLIEKNKDSPEWYIRVDSIVSLVDENGNRYITDEMIQSDRESGMPEYLIQQEYYGNVTINQETKYFAHPISYIYENNKIKENIIVPNTNLFTAWDLGVNDQTAITLFQIYHSSGTLFPKIIGYLENNNQDLNFYINQIRIFMNKHHLILKKHFLPHDGKKRDFNLGLKTTIDIMQEMGETAMTVNRPTSKEVAIEMMRRMLYRCEFQKFETDRLIDCLSNYSKEYDDRNQVYKNRPIHNWAVHGVDSFQTMTLAIESNLISFNEYEISYYIPNA